MRLRRYKADIYRYRLPFVQPLKFGQHWLTYREGLILALEHHGNTGWGEIAPLPGFSKETLTQAHHALTEVLKNRCSVSSAPASVQFGLSCALRPYPVHIPDIPIYPLLQGEPDTIIEKCNQLRAQGYRRFKLKVGRQEHHRELMLLESLAEQAADCSFSFDANGSLDQTRALALARALNPGQLRYFEEPCGNLEMIQEVASKGIPVALDEHLDMFDAPFDGLHALVIKPSLLGSIDMLKQKLSFARNNGYQAILSSSFESQLGLQHLAQISSEYLPGQEAGLGTANYFSETLLTDQGLPDVTQLERIWTC